MNIITGSWDELRATPNRSASRSSSTNRKCRPRSSSTTWTRSVHAVAYDEAGQPLATGRLLPDGHIGRMAVRKAGRGQGVGGAVLQVLIAAARARRCRGHPQCAEPRRGLLPALRLSREGEPFMEAGIPTSPCAPACKGRAG
jgi:GNAT superfamily N-acetyltransferase